MRLILRIAKAELRSLTYVPTAWFVTLVFYVICAYAYFKNLMQFVLSQDFEIERQGAENYWNGGESRGSLTIEMIGQGGDFKNGIIGILIEYLYLIIPIITMNVISREKSSGTFKLLYSSPVKIRQMVLGKYLSLIIFNLVLTAIMGIFFTLAAVNIKSVDYGLMISVAMGFYLLACSYAAIGLFMSSLTHYQVIAAIGTFLILALLGQVGNLWQRVDFVRDLTYFLSMHNRVENMLAGLITTREIIYFLVIIALFLGLTVLRLKNAQIHKAWFVNAGRVTLVIVVALVVIFFTSRPKLTGYWDLTANKRNTIAPELQAILKEFGAEPVDIVLYTNLLDQAGVNKGLPENRNKYITEVWDPILRFKPDINFKYEYYYDYDARSDDSTLSKNFPGKSIREIAESQATNILDIELSRFKTPAEIKRIIDLSSEEYRLVIQLKYKERSEFLRTGSSGTWPNLANIAAAFKRLKSRDIPKVYYLSGHLERDIFKRGERFYLEHSNNKKSHSALVNLGFNVDTISLNNREIPSDADIIVIADPKTNIENIVLRKLKKYLREGGNMYILGEPGKQGTLNPLLKETGVQLHNGQLVQLNHFESAEKIAFFPQNTSYLLDGNANKSSWSFIRSSKAITILTGATAVNYSDSAGYRVKPVFVSENGASNWFRAEPFDIDSIAPVFSAYKGDLRGSLPTLIALSRNVNGKDQRILVSGDADFMSNLRMNDTKYQPTYIMALYAWLGNGNYPVSFSGIQLKDIFLTNLNINKVYALKTIFLWVLPGFVLIVGGVFLIRRGRS